MYSWQHYESLIASDLLTRPNNQFLLQLTEILCSQPASQGTVCFGGAKERRLKTEGERDCLNPKSFLCFSLCLDGIFLDLTEIPVWQSVQKMEGRVDELYSRVVLSSRDIWGMPSQGTFCWGDRGESRRKPPAPPCFKSLQTPPYLQVPVTQSLEKHSFPLFNCSPLLSLSLCPFHFDLLLSCPHGAAWPAGKANILCCVPSTIDILPLLAFLARPGLQRWLTGVWEEEEQGITLPRIYSWLCLCHVESH